MAIKSCYISMPFGRKQDYETGRIVDFDVIYESAIKPAAEEAGLVPMRGAELRSVSSAQKALLEAVVGFDVFIADLTMLKPNVLYELGIRHATRRGPTFLVSSNDTKVPFDLSYARVLLYQLNGEGKLDVPEAARVRHSLTDMIAQGIARSDSPVFEFFPQIRVELPPGFGMQNYPQAVREKLAQSRSLNAAKSDLKEAEEVVKSDPTIDPAAILDVLKKHRDLSDWDGVVRFFEGLEGPIRESPEVMQLVALSLNRRGTPEDQDRAIAMMNELISKTGGDSESFGILGRVYKDRYDRDGKGQDLKLAIGAYRAGFEKQPSDYYPAINLIHLLTISDQEKDRAESRKLIPQVRALVMDRLAEKGRPVDYWDLATAVELAVLARDWKQALELGSRMKAQASATWMLESTLRQLRRLADKTMTGQDRKQLGALIDDLGRDCEPALERADA